MVDFINNFMHIWHVSSLLWPSVTIFREMKIYFIIIFNRHSCRVLMTVLFGSYATSSTRAPTHASENTDESLNRLFDDEVAGVESQMGDKLVGFYVFCSSLISTALTSRVVPPYVRHVLCPRKYVTCSPPVRTSRVVPPYVRYMLSSLRYSTCYPPHVVFP